VGIRCCKEVKQISAQGGKSLAHRANPKRQRFAKQQRPSASSPLPNGSRACGDLAGPAAGDLGGKPVILGVWVCQTLRGLLQGFGCLDRLPRGSPGELSPARLLHAGERGSSQQGAAAGTPVLARTPRQAAIADFVLCFLGTWGSQGLAH